MFLLKGIALKAVLAIWFEDYSAKLKYENSCLKITRHFKMTIAEHKTKWSSHTHEADIDCKLHGSGQVWIILLKGRTINLWITRNNNTFYHNSMAIVSPSEWWYLRWLNPVRVVVEAGRCLVSGKILIVFDSIERKGLKMTSFFILNHWKKSGANNRDWNNLR